MSLKIIVRGLNSPRVTIKYPYTPHHVPEDFRGKVEIDPEKCMGCGACANVCPSEAIKIQDDGEPGIRVLSVFYGRCIFCGRCEENCPVQAIMQSSEFELSALKREDLELKVIHELLKGECGHYLEYTGREVVEAKEILSSMYNRELVEKLLEHARTCNDCRRRRGVEALSKALRPGAGHGGVA